MNIRVLAKIGWSNHRSFVLVSLIFVASVLLIRPWGEFAVNDDWDFFLHVREFSQGHYAKNSLIDSVFILQGLIAVVWTKFFGLSFTSLRILTLVVTFFSMLAFYKILTVFNLPDSLKLVTLLTFIFNPFVYYSSMTFMTENYFLLFMLWSIYFFLSYLKKRSFLLLLLAALFGALSCLVRQFGLIIFIAYLALLIIDLFTNAQLRKQIFISIITTVLIFGGMILIDISWAQFSGDHTDRMSSIFITPSDIPIVIEGMVNLLPYVGFFLSPLLLLFFYKFDLRTKFYLVLFAFPLGAYFFTKDVFAIGNVFHLEGILIRDEITIDYSLFNNIWFKLIFSGYISIFILTLLLEVCKVWLSDIKKDFGLAKDISSEAPLTLEKIFLLLLLAGFLISVFITQGFFDRYFINAFVIMLILVANKAYASGYSFSKKILFVPLIVFCFINFSLTQDFFTLTRLKWEQAKVLSNRTKLIKGIYVTNPYLKYNYVSQIGDFSKVTQKFSGMEQYSCFVQSYTQSLFNTPNINKRFLILKNPTIQKNTEKVYIKIEDNLDRLVYKQEYISVPKMLAGQRSFVGSYCVKGFKRL